MSEHVPNELVILGVGNDSRGDDGLGWAFLDALEKDPSVHARLIYRYQLQPEDVAEIAGARRVLFVDATKEHLEKGFLLEPGKPDRQPMVNSHWLPPSVVLGYCLQVYGACPDAWVLSISGRQWGLGQGLSKASNGYLNQALECFREWYREEA